MDAADALVNPYPLRFFVPSQLIPYWRMIPLGRAPKGTVRGTAASGVNRTEPRYGRFLVRPYGLVASRWEVAVAGLCVLLLCGVFVTEIITPNVVVSSAALLPLLAAVWTLSGRFAAMVTVVAVALLSLAFVLETSNRVTVFVVGAAILATSWLARLYANTLAHLLSSHHHRRPGTGASDVPRTLDGVDSFAHGIRSLTRREIEVASLAAYGYSTVEIAGQLRIGDRTVESHLANIYSKLLISSRKELIRMASGLDSVSETRPRPAAQGWRPLG